MIIVAAAPHPRRAGFTPRAYLIMKMPLRLLALALAGVALTAFSADVASNWKEHCAKCHGDSGKGDTKMGKKLSIADLTDPAVQAKFTDAEALKAMKEGIKNEAGTVRMKPVEGLSEEEMKAMVQYVRSLKQ